MICMYLCDEKDQKAVARSINFMFQCEVEQLLPDEDLAIFVGDQKLTSDLIKTVRFQIGRERAKVFLVEECN